MNKKNISILLILFGVIGLSMTACGGFYFIAGAFDPGNYFGQLFMIVSVLIGIIPGGLILFLVWRNYDRIKQGNDVG